MVNPVITDITPRETTRYEVLAFIPFDQAGRAIPKREDVNILQPDRKA
jgi:hypothetical protein